jgi:SpoVK/Ycf46/Vps4 family AAA+-type ATPase
MAEPLLLTLPRHQAAGQDRVSQDLNMRAARLAERIADVLEENCGPGPEAATTTGFLRSYASTATGSTGTALPGATPLAALTERYGLCDDEVTLLLLAGLPEEHEGLASTFRTLHPRAEPWPTVGLAALLLYPVTADRARLRWLLSEGQATRHGLIQVAGDGPLFERSLVVSSSLWDTLHGVDGWPPHLDRVTLPPIPPAGLDGWLELPAVRLGIAALRSRDMRTILLPTVEETVTLARCAAMLTRAGAVALAARMPGPDSRSFGTLAAHAAARSAIPLVALGPTADGDSPAARLDLGDVPGPVIVCAPPGAVRPAGVRPVVAIPVSPVRAQDRRRCWQAALPHLAAQAPLLAARHVIDPATVDEVAADLLSRRRLHAEAKGLSDCDEAADVAAVIRSRAGVTMPAGVELLTPAAGWDRLVLPSNASTQLHDAVDRLRDQSIVLDDWQFSDGARANRGVRLLFAGPPGTGKSLAAEVVATAADTDLLVVDISRIVSKWIGETEKNLAAAFDVAERTQAVLLLDEADALFASRTEISDAHDRYANLQTAYLLQRLDRFDGLAVLASNIQQNIDLAFVRRMDFVIEFTLPDEAHRMELWRLHLPPQAPLAPDVDVEVLARLYPVPGAWIRNAAIAAAFLAAAAGSRIRQRHLVSGIRREYAKAVRPFPGDPPVLGRRGAAAPGNRSEEKP